MQDTIVILEEGNQNYPICPKYDMFVSQQDLNRRKPSTGLCHRGENQNCCQLVEEELRVGEATALTTYGIPLAVN